MCPLYLPEVFFQLFWGSKCTIYIYDIRSKYPPLCESIRYINICSSYQSHILIYTHVYRNRCATIYVCIYIYMICHWQIMTLYSLDPYFSLKHSTKTHLPQSSNVYSKQRNPHHIPHLQQMLTFLISCINGRQNTSTSSNIKKSS